MKRILLIMIATLMMVSCSSFNTSSNYKSVEEVQKEFVLKYNNIITTYQADIIMQIGMMANHFTYALDYSIYSGFYKELEKEYKSTLSKDMQIYYLDVKHHCVKRYFEQQRQKQQERRKVYNRLYGHRVY